MKYIITGIILIFLLSQNTLHAKQMPSAEQQLKFYQDLRAENHITEQAFKQKTQYLKHQLKQQPIRVKAGGTASISGQVFNSGTAVSDVAVLLFDATTRNYIEELRTDLLGQYNFTNLNSGNYYLYTRDAFDDYIDAIWTSTGTQLCKPCIIPPQAYITLANGDVSSGHDLHLTVGATLTGKIVDSSTNNPVETLHVELTIPGVVNGMGGTQFDGLGNYKITGIPAGSYQVYLKRIDFDNSNMHIPELYNNIQCNLCYIQASNANGTPVTLTNGVTQSGIDFSLEKGAKIEGRLLDGITTDPLNEWGLIYVFNESNLHVASQLVYGTNQDPAATGAYLLGGLLPGTYFVQGGDGGNGFYVRELYANKPCPWSGCDRGAGGTPIHLGAQEHRRGINFLLEYGGKISGNVTDSLTGLPINEDNQYIQFYNSAGEVAGGAYIDLLTGNYTSNRAIPAGVYSVRTGSMFNGTFTSGYIMEKYNLPDNIDCPGVTCDLTAGNVTVNIYDPYSGSPDPEADATTSGIDFALDSGFSFSGSIYDSNNSPLSRVHVLVYDDSGVFAHWATTNNIGSFTVSGLPAGTYYAKTNNGSNLPFIGIYPESTGSWIDILYNNLSCPGSACDVTTGTPIVLGSGSPDEGLSGAPQYSFILPDGGTFTGRLIHSETSSGVPNTQVNVYNSQGEFYGGYESDVDGYWMTSGFPADTYYLVTQGRGGMVDVKYGGDYCFSGQCDPLTADPIVLGGIYHISGLNMVLKPDFIFRSGMD